MVFADLFFIYVFLPLCLICYGLAKKLSTKNIVLIVFSLIFYAWGEPLWILLLLFSSFFNWFIGILIGKFRDTPRAKLAVGGGIFVDILLLLIFKICILPFIMMMQSTVISCRTTCDMIFHI